MSKNRKSNFGEKVLQDSERQQRDASSYGYLKLPKGANIFSPEPDSRVKLDFLPYEVTDPKHPDRNEENEIATEGSLWYKRPFSVHRNIGVNRDSVVCLASVGKKCPICEYRAKRIREGAPKEETDAIKQSKRILYVVVPLDSKKHEAKPHVFDISYYLFQELLNTELKDYPENGIFPSLEDGLTLKVRFDSSTIGKSQPFAEASRIDFLDRDEQYTEKILDEVPNLDEMLTILPYKELEAKFTEMEEENDGGKLSKDEDEPVRTRTRKTEKEEESDDEKPTRGSRRPAKEEEEEPPRRGREKKEEEDEPPTRGRSSRSTKEDEEKPTRGSKSSKDEAPEKGKCPHGYIMGRDFEKNKVCETCDSWDECYEKNKGR